MKVLVIGGSGTFGRRLIALLRDDPRLTLVAASRSGTPVEGAETLELDRTGEIAARLTEIGPDIVIDASGPFQVYRGDPYRVVRAAIGAGAHYIDLADATGFVTAIASLDAEARAKERFALSGASTFPALSGAAVRALAENFDKIERVTMGVAPSPHVRMGRSVIEAIASYAGQPVGERRGLIDTRRATLKVPGTLPLGPLTFALVDVPDPELMYGYPVWAGAGTRPQVLLLALRLAARAVSSGLLPSLSRFAAPMHWAQNRIAWGEHRGGFFVEAEGVKAGKPSKAGWHLLAEGDLGPFVPTIAAAALVRRCLDGRMPPPGARAAHQELELADFSPFLDALGIKCGFVRNSGTTLYGRLLGEELSRLPACIASTHGFDTTLRLRGRAQVTRGGNPLSRLIGRSIGFPSPASDVEVEIEMRREGRKERWTRRFGGAAFQSLQEEGQGRFEGLLVERFGPLAFGMALVRDGGRLRFVQRRWSAFGMPMPAWLGPRIDAFEHGEDGRFHFDVSIALPVAGLIVRYRGWLEPA